MICRSFQRPHGSLLHSRRCLKRGLAHQAADDSSLLVLGLAGSGKTRKLVDDVLGCARALDEAPQDAQHKSILVITRHHTASRSLETIFHTQRPLGCLRIELQTVTQFYRSVAGEFGLLIGRPARSIDYTAQLDRRAAFLHRHLDELPLTRLRPVGAQENFVHDLLHFFSRLGHCGVEPPEYLAYVHRLKQAGPEGAFRERANGAARSGGREELDARAAKGSLAAWDEAVETEMEKARAYEAFSTLKRRENFPDSYDELLKARAVLRGSALARETLKRRYVRVFAKDIHLWSPVVVDALAAMAGDGGKAGRVAVTAVTASADPSLVRSFAKRLRSVEAYDVESPLARFMHHVPAAQVLTLPGCHEWGHPAVAAAAAALAPGVGANLKKPSRSPAAPIHSGAAAEVKMEAAVATSDPAAPSKNEPSRPSASLSGQGVLSGSSGTGGDGGVTCQAFRCEAQELSALVKNVSQLLESGVAPSEVAVMCPKHRHLKTVAAAFSAAGLPVPATLSSDALPLDKAASKTLLAFLRCLLYPSDSTSMLRLLLACPRYAIPDVALSKAMERHLQRHVPLPTLLEDLALGWTPPSARGATDRPPRSESELEDFSEAQRVAALLLDDLRRFRQRSRHQSAAELLTEFVEMTGMRERWLRAETAADEEDAAAATQLFDALREAAQIAGGAADVASVEPILTVMQQYGLRTSLSGGSEDVDAGAEWPSLAPEEDQALQITRLSRVWEGGTRFHTAFLPFLTQSIVPGPLRRHPLPVPRPLLRPGNGDVAAIDNLADAFRIDAEPEERKMHDHYHRGNLYAALSRTGHAVRFSYAVGTGNVVAQPCQYIAEAVGAAAAVARAGGRKPPVQQSQQLDRTARTVEVAALAAERVGAAMQSGRDAAAEVDALLMGLRPSTMARAAGATAEKRAAAAAPAVQEAANAASAGEAAAQRRKAPGSEMQNSSSLASSTARLAALPRAASLVGGATMLLATPREVAAPSPLRLSHTSIYAYDRCPHSYYLGHVLRVSPPPSPLMVYGKALHEAVASFLERRNDGSLSSASEAAASTASALRPVLKERATAVGIQAAVAAAQQVFLEHFEGCRFVSAWQVEQLRARGLAGAEQFVRRHWAAEESAGKANLREIHVEHRFEVPLDSSGAEGIVLSGVFDRVDRRMNAAGETVAVEVTDYKSNMGVKDARKMAAQSLQLKLYGLAAGQLFGRKPSSLVIESIEDGRRGAVERGRRRGSGESKAARENSSSTLLDDLGDTVALAAIARTARGVRAARFDAAPSAYTCSACAFLGACRHAYEK